MFFCRTKGERGVERGMFGRAGVRGKNNPLEVGCEGNNTEQM